MKAKKEPGTTQTQATAPAAPPRSNLRKAAQEDDVLGGCYTCAADLNQTKRAIVDGLGNRVEDGCAVCVNTVAEGWPGVSWSKACERQLA